jgi:hypothetical protein
VPINKTFIVVADFDSHFEDIATFEDNLGNVKRLRMYVDHHNIVITYQVLYNNVVVHTGLIYTLFEATILYNGARERG